MYCTVYIFKNRKKQNGPRVERGPPEVSQNSRVEKLDWFPKSFSFMISTRRRSIPENPRKENKNTHATTKSVSPRIVAIVGCTWRTSTLLWWSSMILVHPDYFPQLHLLTRPWKSAASKSLQPARLIFVSARRVERWTPKRSNMVRCLAMKLLSKTYFARIWTTGINTRFLLLPCLFSFPFWKERFVVISYILPEK